MRLDEERGINFRQAQGVEKQCPFVPIIEIAEELIGEKEDDRDAFCHIKLEDIKMSDGDPQYIKSAKRTPEMACRTACKSLLQQLGTIIEYRDSKSFDCDKEKILDRWKMVISENKNPKVWNFGHSDTDQILSDDQVIDKVSLFAHNKLWQISITGCEQAPQV